MHSITTLKSAAAIAALSLAAFATAAVAAGAPSVIAMNQKLNGNEVLITYANIPKDGYLVIHPSQDNGRVGTEVLGEVQLPAGDHRNIKVKIDGKVATGTKLWAELQPGDGKTGGSTAFTDFGKPVEQSFKLL